MKAIRVKNSVYSLENFFKASPCSSTGIRIMYTTGHVTSHDAFCHHDIVIDTEGCDNNAIIEKIYEIVTEK